MVNVFAEKITAEGFLVLKKDIIQETELFMSKISEKKSTPRYPL